MGTLASAHGGVEPRCLLIRVWGPRLKPRPTVDWKPGSGRGSPSIGRSIKQGIECLPIPSDRPLSIIPTAAGIDRSNPPSESLAHL